MAMELLRKTGAMHYVIPELEETFDMTQNKYHFGTVWEHTMAVLGNLKSDCLELRMAALLHDIGKIRVRRVEDDKVQFLKHELASADMVDELLRPLKYSNDFIEEVTFLVKNHMISKAWGYQCECMKTKKLRKLQFLCNTEHRFNQLMLLIDADNNAHRAEYNMPRQVELILKRTDKMRNTGSTMFGYKLPLTGKDIIEIKGIKPGPVVKEYQDYLLKLAFVNPLRNKEEMIKHLKGYKI
jgi:putative nucleotidyltransferase with HDIG domain